MQIDFYEEFPIRENLEKLKLIKFKIRLFVAAKSLEKFKELEKQIKKIKKNVEVAYWPIVKNSYWISPFSNTEDLIDLFAKLDTIKNPLLVDLELPILNKKMILKNLSSFSKNKKMIKKMKTRFIVASILGISILTACDKQKTDENDLNITQAKSEVKNASIDPIVKNAQVLTKVTIYDARSRLVAVIDDKAELSTLNNLFLDKKLVRSKKSVGFSYRLDMLIDGENHQWLYEASGKIQISNSRTAPVYQLDDWQILSKYIAM